MTRKKPTKSQLEKKLDTVFSQYIRLKHSDAKGYCRCISCGHVHHWKKIQNGHYMSRRYKSTRWSEDNCRPQCVGCNIFNQGNAQMFRRGLIAQIGEQRVDLIEARARQSSCRWSSWELEQLIKDYAEKVSQLKKEKSICE